MLGGREAGGDGAVIGWLKMHRKAIDSDVASSDELLGFFVRLLLVVNHKRKRFRGRWIDPGQIAFGYRTIGERLYRATEKPPAIGTIRRRVKELETLGVITVENVDRQYSLLTICNYAVYQNLTQDVTHQTESVSDSDTPADTGTDTGTDTELRRNKKGKNEEKARPRDLKSVIDYARTLDPAKYRHADRCAEAFVDHYEANGWRQGKGTGRPIKDWQAAFRGWVRRQSEFRSSASSDTDAPASTSYAPAEPVMTREQLAAWKARRQRRVTA
jgi:hypothetical protein